MTTELSMMLTGVLMFVVGVIFSQLMQLTEEDSWAESFWFRLSITCIGGGLTIAIVFAFMCIWGLTL